MNGGSAKSRKAAGFTIVEVMIVMAVTGALFVAVALTMAGKQRKAEFFQASNDIQAVTQQTINEVASGYYPSMNNLVCQQTAGPATTITTGVRQQGTNQQCVFLGKVMYFGVSGTNPEQYKTFSVAGLRSGTSLATSDPTVVQAGGVSTTITGSLKYGLHVLSVKYNNVAGDAAANDVSVGAVAFVSSLGDLDGGGNLKSGSPRLDLIPIPSTGLNRTEATMISNVDTLLRTTTLINPRNGVKVCFQGGGNQTALMTIGSNGHDLQSKIEVKACT